MLERYPQCQLALAGCTGRSEVAAHVVDAADGGRYVEDNLVGACNHCNSKLGGHRSHHTAPPEQGGAGGQAPLDVGGSGDQPPPLHMRLR